MGDLEFGHDHNIINRICADITEIHKNNIEISCLSCNIRRRCMYHDRFRFTKQLNLVKLDHTSEPTPTLNITHDNISDSK